MKFADIKNDIAFRKIFGNAKKTKILISFLNAILKLQGESKIKSVKIENPYQFPRVLGEKASILDVRATEISGRQFIVEMQVAEADGFAKRVQYYASRDYSMQISRGDDYTKLNPTVFIGILDFNYFKGKNYLSYHSLLDEETLEHKLIDLRFAFIELPKFKKKERELENMIDQWIYFIKKSENLDFIPDYVADEGLKEAYLEADRHKWTKKDLKDYDNHYMALQDAKGRESLAEKRGKQDGEYGKSVEIAKNAIKKGLDNELIADLTALSVEKIEELRQQ